MKKPIKRPKVEFHVKDVVVLAKVPDDCAEGENKTTLTNFVNEGIKAKIYMIEKIRGKRLATLVFDNNIALCWILPIDCLKKIQRQ